MAQAPTSAAPRTSASRLVRSARTGTRVGIAQDEARLGYRCGIYDLLLPSASRVRALKVEEAELALIVEEPLILLAYRFGETIPWTFARFTWQDSPRHEQIPPGDCRERGLLAIGLRRPEGQSPEPVRNLTLSLDFTRALDDAVRDQARMAYAPQEEARALEALRRRYPSTHSLLSRAVARTVGMP